MADYQEQGLTDTSTRKRKASSSPFFASEMKDSNGDVTAMGICKDAEDSGQTHQLLLQPQPQSITLPQQNTTTPAGTIFLSNGTLPPSFGVNGNANESSAGNNPTSIAAALGVEALKADLTSKFLLAYVQEQAKQQEKVKQQVSELANSIGLAQPPSGNIPRQEPAEESNTADASRERSAPLDLLTAAIRQLQEQSRTHQQGPPLGVSHQEQPSSPQPGVAQANSTFLPALCAPSGSQPNPPWPQQQQQVSGTTTSQHFSAAPAEASASTTEDHASAALHLLFWKPRREPVPEAATNTAPYQRGGTTLSGQGTTEFVPGAVETPGAHEHDKIRLLNGIAGPNVTSDHSSHSAMAAEGNASDSFSMPPRTSPEPAAVTSAPMTTEVGGAISDTVGFGSGAASSTRTEQSTLHQEERFEEGHPDTVLPVAKPSMIVSAENSLHQQQLLPVHAEIACPVDEPPSHSKMTRLERKKYREKQRRLDLHEGFRQLKETMLRIDPSSWTEGATGEDDGEEGASTPRKAPSGSGADDEGADGDPAAMNRVELLRRAVQVLERINAESEEHKSLTTRLASQLAETEQALSQVVAVFNNVVSNQQGAASCQNSASQTEVLQPQTQIQLALARALLSSQEGTQAFSGNQPAPSPGVSNDVAAALLGVGLPLSTSGTGSLLLQSMPPIQTAAATATANASTIHALAALAAQTLPAPNPSANALLLGLLGSLGQPKG